ncbi:hypothetical protein UlMin_002492 [Ulmus minor]
MKEAMVSRYWCHVCSQIVNPIVEVEIKFPFCQSGFVEEMSSSSTREGRDVADAKIDFGSNRALSLWAPILLGRMGNPWRRRRFRRIEFDDNDDDDGIRTGLASESQNFGLFRDRDRDRDDRERVILINPFTMITSLVSVWIYCFNIWQRMILTGMEALPIVMIKENFQCSICLDDFEIGSEAKQMPCKHRFHSGCILPWLELHSSYPICRFQLPSDDESKRDRFRGEDDRF